MKKVVICGVNTATLPTLKNAEMDELMKKVKAGDELAKEEFIVANMRLVLSIVQKFSGKSEKADDMFQVGCVGLIKAINNFDPSYGLRFSTYAVPMIIGEIRRFLRDNNAIRVSRSMRDIAYRALQVKNQISQIEHREASIDEIAQALDLPTKSVAFALDAISETVSLSNPISESHDGETSFLDQLADTRSDNCINDEKISLHSAIVGLSEREKEILQLRYFIGKTQTEVSKEVGISQAQVSRLEKNALDSIKKQMI
ncbi:MAG: SigB/SigF/SigG family RNA polymerase sigma factor [Clostridia bacterium]